MTYIWDIVILTTYYVHSLKHLNIKKELLCSSLHRIVFTIRKWIITDIATHKLVCNNSASLISFSTSL